MDEKTILINIDKCLMVKNSTHLANLRHTIKKINLREYPEIYQKYAFLLYHQNLAWFQYTKNKQRHKIAENNLLEAMKIYKQILKLRPSLRSYSITVNSRTGLAQILGFLGERNKSIKMARNTYKIYPNALTANRLGAVYLEQSMKKEALFWYKKYEKLALKTDLPKYFIYSDMAAIYKKCGEMELFEKYHKLVCKYVLVGKKNKGFWLNFNKMLGRK